YGDLTKGVNARQRLQVTARLNAGPDDRQRLRRFPRQQPRRYRRYRGGSGFGDVAAVDQRLQRSRIWIEQHDRGEMGGQTARMVAADHGDDLRAERLVDVARARARP